jgi:hypothetical protein
MDEQKAHRTLWSGFFLLPMQEKALLLSISFIDFGHSFIEIDHSCSVQEKPLMKLLCL